MDKFTENEVTAFLQPPAEKKKEEPWRDHCRLLAQFLLELPKKRLRMDCWVGWDWQGKPDLSCGTVACAAGWATTIPDFRKLGLRMADRAPIVSRGRDLDDLFGPGAEVFYRMGLRNPETVAFALLQIADNYEEA